MAMMTPSRLNKSATGSSVTPLNIKNRLTSPLVCSSTIQAAMRTSTEVQKGSNTRISIRLALRSFSVDSQ